MRDAGTLQGETREFREQQYQRRSRARDPCRRRHRGQQNPIHFLQALTHEHRLRDVIFRRHREERALRAGIAGSPAAVTPPSNYSTLIQGGSPQCKPYSVIRMTRHRST